MSANLISLPFRPALNLSGTFESGARLTVYRADSTTLEPIFADSSLTVRLPNPMTTAIVADYYVTRTNNVGKSY